MRALVAIVTGFVSGVFLRSLLFTDSAPLIFALFLAVILAGATFLTARRAYTLGAVFCMFLALGGLRAGLAESPLPNTFLADLKHRVTYDAIVVGDPDLRDTNQRVALLVTKGDVKVKMLAVAPRTPEVKVGDTVRVSGTLSVPEPFADDNGRVFRYDKYLERDGIRFVLNFATLRVEKIAPWYSVSALFARIKHAFINGLNAALPEPYASLAGGIVIGGKSGLGNDLKDAFVRSGLVHIIVLSGYNVMVVAEWVMAALALTRLKKRYAIAAGILALILFVGIAGATAPAIRAALMAVIALYARATGRTYAASRALLVVVLAMLVWNPLYLVFDPGFGLSVAATVGLIWLAPLIEARLMKIKNAFLKNAIATTLAAQIAVLPLLLYNTGNLSFVAIPANILIVPFVPLAMAWSMIAGLGGMIFGAILPFGAIVLGLPAYLLTAFLIFVAQASAALPYASILLPAFPFILTLTAYAALAYAIARLNRSSTTSQFKLAKNASM